MATYYLVHKHNKTLLPLGDVSFTKFYVEDGFHVMMTMVNNNDISINNYIIRRDDSPEEFTIEEFIDQLATYQMMGI